MNHHTHTQHTSLFLFGFVLLCLAAFLPQVAQGRLDDQDTADIKASESPSESTSDYDGYDPGSGWHGDTSNDDNGRGDYDGYDPSDGYGDSINYDYGPDDSSLGDGDRGDYYDPSDGYGDSSSGSGDNNGSVQGGLWVTPPTKSWYEKITDAAAVVAGMAADTVTSFGRNLVESVLGKPDEYATLPTVSGTTGGSIGVINKTNTPSSDDNERDDGDVYYMDGLTDAGAEVAEVPQVFTDQEERNREVAKEFGINLNNTAAEGAFLLATKGMDENETRKLLEKVAETGGNFEIAAQKLAFSQTCGDANCRAADVLRSEAGLDQYAYQEALTEAMQDTAAKRNAAVAVEAGNVKIITASNPTTESDAEIAAAEKAQKDREAERNAQVPTVFTPVITVDKMKEENTVRDFDEGIAAANETADQAETALEAAKKAADAAKVEREGTDCLISALCSVLSGLTGGDAKVKEANDALAEAQKKYDAAQAALVAIDAGKVQSIKPDTASIDKVIAKAAEVLGHELSTQQEASLEALMNEGGVLPADIIDELNTMSRGDLVSNLWKVEQGWETESDVWSSNDKLATKVKEQVAEIEGTTPKQPDTTPTVSDASDCDTVDCIAEIANKVTAGLPSTPNAPETPSTVTSLDDVEYLAEQKRIADAYVAGLEKKATENIIENTVDCGFLGSGCWVDNFNKYTEEQKLSAEKAMRESEQAKADAGITNPFEGFLYDAGKLFGLNQTDTDPQTVANNQTSEIPTTWTPTDETDAEKLKAQQEQEEREAKENPEIQPIKVADNSVDDAWWNFGSLFGGQDETEQSTEIKTETTPDGASDELVYYVDGKRVVVTIIDTKIVVGDEQATDCASESSAGSADCSITTDELPGPVASIPPYLYADGLSTNLVETPSITSVALLPDSSISDIDVTLLDNDVQVISIPATSVGVLNIRDTEKIELDSSQTSFVPADTFDDETLDSTNFQEVEQDLKVILPKGQEVYATEQGFPAMSPGELFLIGELDVADEDLDAINLALRGELPGSTIRAVNNGDTLEEADLIEISGIVTTIVNRAISRNTTIYDQVFKPKAYSSVTVDKRAYTVNDEGFTELVENLADGTYADDYGLTNIEPDELAFATHYYSADGIESQTGLRTPGDWDIDQSDDAHYYVSTKKDSDHLFGNAITADGRTYEYSVVGKIIPVTTDSEDRIMLAYAYNSVTNPALAAIEEVDTSAKVETASIEPDCDSDCIATKANQYAAELATNSKTRDTNTVSPAEIDDNQPEDVDPFEATFNPEMAPEKNKQIEISDNSGSEGCGFGDIGCYVSGISNMFGGGTGSETEPSSPADNMKLETYEQYYEARIAASKASEEKAKKDAEALKLAHPEYTDVKVESVQGFQGFYTVTALKPAETVSTPSGYTPEQQAVIDAGKKLGLTSDSEKATLLLMAEEFKEQMPDGYKNKTVAEAIIGTLTDTKNQIIAQTPDKGGDQTTLLNRLFNDFETGKNTVETKALGFTVANVTEKVRKGLIAAEKGIEPEQVTDAMIAEDTEKQKSDIAAKKAELAAQLADKTVETSEEKINLLALDTSEKAALLNTTEAALKANEKAINDVAFADYNSKYPSKTDDSSDAANTQTTDNCNWLCDMALSPFGGVEGAREKLENLIPDNVTTYSDTVLKHTEAKEMLLDAGVTLNENGSVKFEVVKAGTIQGVKEGTIQGVIDLQKDCNCTIVVTSALDGDHADGDYSHDNGYKIDLRSRDEGTDLVTYIEENYEANGARSNGDKLYVDDKENPTVEFAFEGNHIDATFYPYESGKVQTASIEPDDSPSLAERSLDLFNSLFPPAKTEVPQVTKADTSDSTTPTPAGSIPPLDTESATDTPVPPKGNGLVVDGIVDVVSKTGNAVVDFFTGLFGGGGGSNSGDNSPTSDSDSSSTGSGSNDTDTTVTPPVQTPLQTIDLVVNATKATQGTGTEFRFQGSINRSVTDGSSDNELPIEELQKYFSTVIDNRLNVDYNCNGTVDVQKTFTISYRSFISGQNETSVLLSEYLGVAQPGEHCFFFEGDTKNVVRESTETNNTSKKVRFISS